MESINKVQAKEEKKYKLSLPYRFFCWCSGARMYLLKQCPSEYNKHYGIGVIVFLTGVLASLSGGYAIYTAFNDLHIAIGFGMLWGFVIFSIDWYIVASLRKQNKWVKEFSMALPRFVLAILIAFVISMPLKLKLFEKEIEQQMHISQHQGASTIQTMIDEQFAEVSFLEEQIQQLRLEITEKEKYRDKLFEMLIEEAEGRSPTQRAGKGAVYREKRDEYQKVAAELNIVREKNLASIEDYTNRLNNLRKEKDATLETSRTVQRNSDGFLARLEAMNELSKRNRNTQLASWFIILLFITIESAPIIVKLISARGPYDDLLEAEEYIKQAEIRKQIMKAELSEEHQIDLHSLLEKERNENLYTIEKEHIANESKVLREVNKLKLKIWEQKELGKLRNEIAQLKEVNDQERTDLLASLQHFDTKDIAMEEDEVPLDQLKSTSDLDNGSASSEMV